MEFKLKEASKTVEVGDLVISNMTGYKYMVVESLDSEGYQFLNFEHSALSPMYDTVGELLNSIFLDDEHFLLYKSEDLTLTSK